MYGRRGLMRVSADALRAAVALYVRRRKARATVMS